MNPNPSKTVRKNYVQQALPSLNLESQYLIIQEEGIRSPLTIKKGREYLTSE